MAGNENGCFRLHGTVGWDVLTGGERPTRLDGTMGERDGLLDGNPTKRAEEEESEYDVKSPLPVFALAAFLTRFLPTTTTSFPGQRQVRGEMLTGENSEFTSLIELSCLCANIVGLSTMRIEQQFC